MNTVPYVIGLDEGSVGVVTFARWRYRGKAGGRDQ